LSGKHWWMVIIRDDRWAGTTTRLDRALTPVARIRELRPTEGGVSPLGLEQREREVLCTLVGSLGRTAFYTPTPGQHTTDLHWPTAAPTILTTWTDPSTLA
jgi:hypothetical protein